MAGRLDDNGVERQKNGWRNGWTIERWISVVTLLVSLSAFVFSLGVNYAQYTQLRAEFDKHLAAEKDTYLRKDVAEQRLANLEDKVEKLHVATDTLIQLLLQERLGSRNVR